MAHVSKNILVQPRTSIIISVTQFWSRNKVTSLDLDEKFFKYVGPMKPPCIFIQSAEKTAALNSLLKSHWSVWARPGDLFLKHKIRSACANNFLIRNGVMSTKRKVNGKRRLSQLKVVTLSVLSCMLIKFLHLIFISNYKVQITQKACNTAPY